jgi:hypothetical protein
VHGSEVQNSARRRAGVRKNQQRHSCQPKYRLTRNVLTGIYKSLRTGQAGKWEKLVGYSLSELRGHLQKQFQKGMTWQNYGQWHIDHIKPVASFNFSSPQDEGFKQCWALKNLRPLWARDNWIRAKKPEGRWSKGESPPAGIGGIEGL